jgi:hypothetical protein
MMQLTPKILTPCALLLLGLGMLHGCKQDAPILAPYSDAPTRLSKIVVQDSTLTPKVNWVGGYASAVGINIGRRASLDSTLVMLVYQPANGVQYPVQVGRVPAGAQDLTTRYGGTPMGRLIEDSTYTYWVMKEDAWNEVTRLPGIQGKTLTVDSAGTSLVQSRMDSVFINASSFVTKPRPTDVFINIGDFKSFGRLAVLSLLETDSTNRPVVSWQVRTAGDDSLISAIGIVRGQEYNASLVQWEMISMIKQPDTTFFWIHNVIPSPIVAGQHVPSTITFTEYPENGLERGYVYYLWIANKNWDREARLRSTPNYAYATFVVW